MSIFKPTHIHKKTGKKYQLLECVGLQKSTEIEDGEICVLYVDKNGDKWVRSFAEFNDGRFKEI